MRITVFFILFALIFPSAILPQNSVCGIVYEDLNKNGKQDPGEPGVQGVMVSNQKEAVLTDASGSYTLPIQKDTIVFVTKPAGYQVPMSSYQLPQFYYIHKPEGSPQLYYGGSKPTGPLPKSVNFALHKVKESDNFKAIVIADPQTETIQELVYLQKDFVEEMIGTDAAFGIILGDNVFDRLDLWEYFNPLFAQIHVPFYRIMGNHDVNYDATEDCYSDETFEKNFGPSYYSFDYGKVHFIALDDIYFFRNKQGKSDYEGRLGKKQLEWVKNDLSLVPSEKLVVFLMHIPFYTYKNDSDRSRIADLNELFEIIKNRKHLLGMSGHTHTHEHHFLDSKMGWHGEKPLHFIVSVTLCGSWWSGPLDDRGVAVADQQDGVPNGYQIMEFTGNQYKSSYRAADKSEKFQMRIHSPVGVMTEEEAKNSKILVNVFDSCEKSQVFYRINSGKFVAMKQTPMKDPFAGQIHSKQSHSVKPWIRPITTYHIWAAPIPKLDKGIHTLTIKTIDFYGRTFVQSRIFAIW